MKMLRRYAIWFILALALFGCTAPKGTPTSPPASATDQALVATPSATVSQFATATPEPSRTPMPSATSAPTVIATIPPTATLTATATARTCFALLAPADGASLPAAGMQTFEWEPWAGATAYQFEIVFPNSWVFSKQTSSTSLARALEALSLGGEYRWQVVALDASGAKLCIAGPYSLTKPASIAGQAAPQNDPDESNVKTG